MISREAIQEREYERKGPYHRRFFTPDAVRYHIVHKLLQRNIEGQMCLDYGGGDAAMASMLAQEGGKVNVFDVSKRALHFAQEADDRLGLVRGKTRLPFRNGAFDIVTMLETLEHIPDDEEALALAEAHRVLKPGGLFAISVPSDRSPVSAKHYRHYALDDLKKKLEANAFEIIHTVSFRRLATEWSGRAIIGKLVRGVLYGADMIVRGIDGTMGLVACLPQDADTFVLLAKRN